jgi:phage terminase large subunit
LHTNSQEIKSTEGIDICWIEEAMSVSEESWAVLIPTVRKEGSEIWVSFNPSSEHDPVYKRFVLNQAQDAYVRKVNYDENPYFPETLRKEMEWLKARDYPEYLHIWEGELKKQSNALIFKDRFSVDTFETPNNARFYLGADWGFATDPSTLIRSYMDGRTIYIDHEAWGVGVDIDETPALFDIVPAARDWPIYADCARPETISYMAKHGFRCKPAPKWQGSIEDGIAWLRAHDIVIHSRCKHLIDEFNRYSYKTDKITGDILPIIVDKYNHGIDALRYAYSNEIQNRNSSWAGLIS